MAKQKKTAKTPVELAYDKELKRIKQFINRASKRGFVWDENVIPNKPKKVTQKSVERLKKITPKVLYSKGEYIDDTTGELLPATHGRHIERQKTAQKAKETRTAKAQIPIKSDTKGKKSTDKKPNPKKPSDGEYMPTQSHIVLDTVRYMISNWMPSPHWSVSFREKKYKDKSILEAVLERAISIEGENNVAQRLEQNGASTIIHIVDAVLFDSDSENVKHNITLFAELLNGGPLSADESQEIADLSEQYENWEQPQ